VRSQLAGAALSLLVAAPLALTLLGFGGAWHQGIAFATRSCAADGVRLGARTLGWCALEMLRQVHLTAALASAGFTSVVAAIGAAAFQGSLGWAPGAIGMRAQGLGPLQRLRRAFNAASAVSALVSAMLVGLLAVFLLPPLFGGLVALAIAWDLNAQVVALGVMTQTIWWRALAVVTASAALEIALNRRRLARSLQMTAREVKEERAETEARPEAKQRRKTIGMRRSRSLRLDAIRAATAVVTNPMHIAVALRYAPPEIDVPIVVARGADLTARIVRNAADEAGVPVVESMELARMLYRRVEVDEPIPEDCYAAVAAVFAWIVRTHGSLRGKGPDAV
jgi:flagellar biosynthesis protein FlhB